MSEIITVTGNIATDPEQRTMRGDDTVTSFRLAAGHQRFDPQSNSWVEVYTNFYSVSAFRALGKNAYAALKKGQRVIVTGRLRVKEWDNGTKKGVTAEIDADGIGHDLLFGVTTFQPAGRPSVPAAAASPAADPPVEAPSASLVTTVDGWGIPQAAGADAPF
jgi:single-strand DNA-binding protein